MQLSGKNQVKSTETQAFQPYQIVCLEHENCRLYAEVVQISDRRPVCWVRPLAMICDRPDGLIPGWANATTSAWHDLRQGADLLLPLALFRPALDTEVLPLLGEMFPACQDSRDHRREQAGHPQLRLLIHRLWQADPEIFQP